MANWLNQLVGTGLKEPLQPVRSRILQEPYYRLRSLSEVRLAAELGVKLDVNRATVDDWLRLPGLSIHQARSLVALSRAGVSFHCVEDIAAALAVPAAALQPLEPVLLFCYYDAERTVDWQPLAINQATIDQLLQIPAIDRTLAEAIVRQRQQGNYRNWVDVQHRLNLSGLQIAELLHYLYF